MTFLKKNYIQNSHKPYSRNELLFLRTTALIARDFSGNYF